jgi:CII-binding regulator of phage lambda lysogenization HflD
LLGTHADQAEQIIKPRVNPKRIKPRVALSEAGQGQGPFLVRLLQGIEGLLEFSEADMDGIGDLSGAIDVTLEVIVHNPLRDQLADLQKTITASLTDIEQKLQLDGEIMQSLANAHDQLLAIQKAVQTFEERLTSSLAEVQQLKASISNLDRKLDGLQMRDVSDRIIR